LGEFVCFCFWGPLFPFPMNNPNNEGTTTSTAGAPGSGGGGGGGGATLERRKKRRWGDASSSSAASGETTVPDTATAVSSPAIQSLVTTGVPQSSAASTTSSASSSTMMDGKAKALALQESVRARLAALKARTGNNVPQRQQQHPPPRSSSGTAGIGGAVTVSASSTTQLATGLQGLGSPAGTILQHPPPAKKAKVYELDMTVIGPTFRSKPEPSKPKVNPYLAHREVVEETVVNNNNNNNNNSNNKKGVDRIQQSTNHIPEQMMMMNKNLQQEQQQQGPSPEEDLYIDERLEQTQPNRNNRRRQRKELHFIEPGTFIDVAERKRQRAANAESAGFASGRKVGQYFQSHTIMANIYGTTDVLDEAIDLGILPPRLEAGGGTTTNSGKVVLSSKTNTTTSTSTMPLVVEWWDMELLPTKLKKQVAAYEGRALSKEAQSQMQRLSTSLSSSTAAAAKTTTPPQKTNIPHYGDVLTADTTTSTISNNTQDDVDFAMLSNNPQIASLISDEAEDLRTKCKDQASLSYSKTAGLIQHIVPIKPPNVQDEAPVEPVLHLTKRELKRQRKLRRQEKQRELQDLQSAGLIPPPEPRLTLKNFIRVLGDQAYVDPSQMEQKVNEQIQARQRAHIERNEAKKLTRDQLSEKRRMKLHEDTSKTGVHVALFYVRNLSHPYHRTKVDLNAQQYNITGGVVECETPKVACVIIEGGPKAIKKYIRLMTVRMKWRGPDNDDDDDVDGEDGPTDQAEMLDENGEKVVQHKFDKENKCELVWTGMATKRLFKGFVFQACESSDQASTVLRAKGVGHFWDQVLIHASGRGKSLHLKLAETDDEEEEEEDDNDDVEDDRDGDVKMTTNS
jgi:U4/U6 small nuclear ribonucleoprotein PRP3